MWRGRNTARPHSVKNLDAVKKIDSGGGLDSLSRLATKPRQRPLRPSPQFVVEKLYNFAVIGAVKDSDERRCENATRRQMARHPQPREVAELKGATRVHPERYRKQPPEVAHELGEAPAHLSAEAQRCWFEIATYAPVGVLKGADRLSLEVLSNLLAEYRGDPEAFAVGKYTHLVGLLARLGMSPADRQKLGAEKPPEGNEFDEF